MKIFMEIGVNNISEILGKVKNKSFGSVATVNDVSLNLEKTKSCLLSVIMV